MHRGKDLHSTIDWSQWIHTTPSCATKMQQLTSVSNTGLCDAAHKLKDPFKAYLLGYMIKAAQPQRSSERKGWGEKLKGYLARCVAPGEIQPPCSGVKPIKTSQRYHSFWLRGWLAMGHGTHDGMQGKSQLRHLCITVRSTSNSNMTVCNLIALQSG